MGGACSHESVFVDWFDDPLDPDKLPPLPGDIIPGGGGRVFLASDNSSGPLTSPGRSAPFGSNGSSDQAQIAVLQRDLASSRSVVQQLNQEHQNLKDRAERALAAAARATASAEAAAKSGGGGLVADNALDVFPLSTTLKKEYVDVFGQSAQVSKALKDAGVKSKQQRYGLIKQTLLAAYEQAQHHLDCLQQQMLSTLCCIPVPEGLRVLTQHLNPQGDGDADVAVRLAQVRAQVPAPLQQRLADSVLLFHRSSIQSLPIPLRELSCAAVLSSAESQGAITHRGESKSQSLSTISETQKQALLPFAQQCVSLCWKFVLCKPPFTLDSTGTAALAAFLPGASPSTTVGGGGSAISGGVACNPLLHDFGYCDVDIRREVVTETDIVWPSLIISHDSFTKAVVIFM